MMVEGIHTRITKLETSLIHAINNRRDRIACKGFTQCNHFHFPSQSYETYIQRLKPIVVWDRIVFGANNAGDNAAGGYSGRITKRELILSGQLKAKKVGGA